MKEDTRIFKEWVDSSNRIIGFTGAGISTESGISDYRSQGGIWNQFNPVYFQEFIQDPHKRILYWQRKQAVWESIKRAEPNSGHLFLKTLYDRKKLLAVITQNIDGLHEKSGIPHQEIVNLHGNTLETICLNCGIIKPTEGVIQDLNLSHGAPLCEQCGGFLKPNTISFGQNLRQEDLDRAADLSGSCDLMLVMGSTLIVHPAASFPALAKKAGAKLIIITLSEIPREINPDLTIHRKIGDFLSEFQSIF